MTADLKLDPWPTIDVSHPADYSRCDCSGLEQHIPIMQAISAKQEALRLWQMGRDICLFHPSSNGSVRTMAKHLIAQGVASLEELHPDCPETELERVSDHPANAVDWDNPGSRQGYQVWRCRFCGAYWGQRFQWDAGTGSDDHWQKFNTDPSSVARHY